MPTHGGYKPNQVCLALFEIKTSPFYFLTRRPRSPIDARPGLPAVDASGRSDHVKPFDSGVM